MKWGNVFQHYLCCHIYYCILYNKKADEKPKTKPNQTVATLGTDHQCQKNYAPSLLLYWILDFITVWINGLLFIQQMVTHSQPNSSIRSPHISKTCFLS